MKRLGFILVFLVLSGGSSPARAAAPDGAANFGADFESIISTIHEGQIKPAACLGYKEPRRTPKGAIDLEAFPLEKRPCIDLRGEDLRNLEFPAGAYLAGANLTETDLRGADLRKAILTDAIWQGARYDQFTQLPFDDAEAVKRQMIKEKSGARKI